MNTYILQLVDPFEVTKGRHLFWGLLKFYRKLPSRSSHNTTAPGMSLDERVALAEAEEMDVLRVFPAAEDRHGVFGQQSCSRLIGLRLG